MITNEQALVKSVLLHKFEEEIYHSDTFEHYGVKGMKWYQHLMAAKDKVKSVARKVKAVYTDPQGLARGDYNDGGKKFKPPTQGMKFETRTKEQINRDDCKYALAQARENCTAERSVKNVAYLTNATEEDVRKVTKEVQKRSKEFQKEFLDNDHFKRTGEKKRVPLNTETSGSVLKKASTVAEQQRMFLFKSKDPSERRKLAIDYLALSDIYAKAIEHYVKDDKNYERFDDNHMVAPMPEDTDFVGAELAFALGWNYDTKQSTEAELIHSVIQHHGVSGMKWYQHLFGDVEKTTEYYKKGKAGEDKPPKKLDQVKEKAKAKAVEATKRTVDTINKAKAKAESVQAEHKRIRDNKKEADRMAKEEKEHIRKLHNDKAEEMTTEELKERNERMKLIKQYNDAYNAVYPNQKEANRKARRELVNTALKGLAEQAPKQILDYAIGSTEYGKRKMQADIRKKELKLKVKSKTTKVKSWTLRSLELMLSQIVGVLYRPPQRTN